MSLKNCPVCDHELKRESRDVVYSYKGRSITVQQPGLYCDGCGESFLEGNDLKATRKAIHDMHAIVDGFLPSDEISRIRRKMKMTQKEAGEIFGGGPNAFSRYERGEARHPKSLDHLLRSIDDDIELLSKISPEHYEKVQSSKKRGPRLIWSKKVNSTQVSGGMPSSSRKWNPIDGPFDIGERRFG